MIPLKGKPLLQHQLELCRAHGFGNVLLLLHHRHEVIIDRFGDGATLGLRLGYQVETAPRGTAGALRDALALLASRFLVLYGDTYLDVDLRRLWDSHAASGAAATLLLHPNDHPHDSDLVQLGRDGRVCAIHPYPHPQGAERRNLVNAALYVMERDGLDAHVPEFGQADIAKHLFPSMLTAGRLLQGHVTPEYIKDIGTPGRLDKVERDIDDGVAERLSSRAPRSAVFLDRDGTINREVEHLRDPSQLELLHGAAAAIKRLNRAGQLAVVVTNQPVLARGDVTDAGLDGIHARLDALLGDGGAYLDGIYVCPHHPDRGFAGEVAALKIECSCRKPKPGLIDQACRELQIGRAGSWLVGDSSADIEAGRLAGLRTVLVRTGHAGGDDKHVLQPDYVMFDLATAVDWILDGHRVMRRQLLPTVEACMSGARLVLVGGLARAGKSAAAQGLKEGLAELGVTAHVVPLDAWLKPISQRSEGAGVLQRYDAANAGAALTAVANATSRVTLETPVYDRRQRAMNRHAVRHSVGPSDVLIVEGVPALIDTQLRRAAQVCVYVEAPEDRRLERLRADYSWRGLAPHEVDALLASRAADEHGSVLASRVYANFIVSSGGLA
jgi:histidinol-phosphate phosphatase family protein